MEMKINFTKLFNFQNTASQSKQSSFHSQQLSVDYSSYLQNQLKSQNNRGSKFQNNRQIFLQDNQYRVSNILQDFSTINKSLQRSLQKSLEKSQQDKSFSSHLKSQYEKHKMPGQRLYYQSQMSIIRKQKQLQRKKIQIIAQQNKDVTFKPIINQKSKKIAQKLTQSPKKQKKTQMISYTAQKEQQQYKKCTFKPNLIAKDKSSFNNRKLKTQVFEELYNDHKVKEMKMKLNMEQQEDIQKKKLTKAQLQDFFHRNQEYIEKQNKKHQMIKHVSTNYDLTSGRKLFSPKIQKESLLFKSTSNRNFPLSTKNSSKKVNLFNKMATDDNEGELNYFSMESKKIFDKQKYNQDQMEQHGGFQSRPSSQKPVKSLHESINKSQIIQQVEEEDPIKQLNEDNYKVKQHSRQSKNNQEKKQLVTQNLKYQQQYKENFQLEGNIGQKKQSSDQPNQNQPIQLKQNILQLNNQQNNFYLNKQIDSQNLQQQIKISDLLNIQNKRQTKQKFNLTSFQGQNTQ